MTSSPPSAGAIVEMTAHRFERRIRFDFTEHNADATETRRVLHAQAENEVIEKIIPVCAHGRGRGAHLSTSATSDPDGWIDGLNVQHGRRHRR